MKSLTTLAFLAAFGLILAQVTAKEGDPRENQIEKKDGDKKKDETKKDEGKDKEEGKKEEVKPPPPKPFLGKVELRDGTMLNLEFIRPAQITMDVSLFGVRTLPLDKISFVDFQGPKQRIRTHTGDIMLGTILTEGFWVQLPDLGAAADSKLELKQDNISRMSFKEPPPVLGGP